MSKKFGKQIVQQLERIRSYLDTMEDCEDGMEMIHIAQELSTDMEAIQELIEEKYNL